MAVTVGLDIGSTGIRAVALDTSKTPPAVRRVGEAELPVGAMVGGEVVDADEVKAAVVRLWKQNRLPKKNVVVGVANQRVIVRQVDVPQMGHNELIEALPFQVSEYIPMAVEDAILDYVPIEEFQTPESEPMLSILAVAAQREMAQELLSVLSSAGLSVQALDLEAFALVRAVFAREFQIDDSQAIVDMGAGISQVVLVRGGIPRFVRILSSGGDSFTGALTDQMGLSPDEAETVKRRVGVQPEDNGSQVPDDDEKEREARQILTTYADGFIDEIRGSVNFYLSQSGEESLSRVVVAGNGARLPHLANRLGRAIDAPVEPARVVDGLNVGKIAEEVLTPLQPVLPTAVGLALWGT